MSIQDAAPQPYKDPKRLLWLISPLVPLFAFGYLCAAYFSGFNILYWAFPIVIYAFMPIVDHFVGVNTSNPPESALEQLDQDPYYRWIIYAFIPSQYALTLFGAWMFSSGVVPIWAMGGLVLTVGMVNGVAFIPAHELTHKKGKIDRWFAKIALAPMAYGHFFAEHVRGHHKNVATPDDPTSAKMGETFWHFLARAIFTGIKSAWEIERERLHRKGKGVWAIENENLHTWSMTIILFGILTAWLGWIALIFLILQALYGVILLEVTDYIEHYGLLRQKQKNGTFEPATPAHAWDSNHVVCSLFLYQLQRHADHHTNAMHRFQSMRYYEVTPQLPASYVTMMLVAYIPPLWFRIMDPRLMKHYKGDLTKANIYPPKREMMLGYMQ